MEDNYAFDPWWKTYLNGKELSRTCEDLIEILKSNEWQNPTNVMRVEYSDTEDGLNAFEVGRQIIWYPITEWKDDDYYLYKEWNRWKLL